MTRWLRIRVSMDRLFAAIMAIMASPIMAACAWRVWAHDGGPPFIKVPRVGRGGRAFGMWKIRTMRVGGDDGLAAGARLTGTGDDRITPVGRTLRQHHLDELPQLLNVVAGDMSLLGPRPEDPAYVRLGQEIWRTVLDMPPGLAGMTQLAVGDWEQRTIAERPDEYERTVLPTKLTLDAWYVKNANMRVDAKILAALARHLLTRKRNDGSTRHILKRSSSPLVAP